MHSDIITFVEQHAVGARVGDRARERETGNTCAIFIFIVLNQGEICDTYFIQTSLYITASPVTIVWSIPGGLN